MNLNSFSSETLEIHYWFVDNSHTMDAVIQNKCEHEILEIIKEVSQIYSLDVIIETGPLGEGGLRRWFGLAFREENQKGTITKGILLAIILAALVKPIENIGGKIVDKLFEDKEILALDKKNKELDIEGKELDNEKKRIELEELKKKVSEKQGVIDQNLKIKKKKSNFYESLASYSKIEKVSYVIIDKETKEVYKDSTVTKSEFRSYILVDDNLDPSEIENASIEIISPVLIKKGYKWMGFYNGEPISFNMKSKEFKKLVLEGKIEFKNGSSIDCLLRIRRKINNDGQEHVVGYDVIRVNSYFENDNSVETKEGRKYRISRGATDKVQLNLFGNEEQIKNEDEGKNKDKE